MMKTIMAEKWIIQTRHSLYLIMLGTLVCSVYIVLSENEHESSSTNEGTGILIVGTEWWPRTGDLPGYVIKKDLVKILTSQKHNVYMTIFNPTEAEKFDAKQNNLNLIEAKKVTPEKLNPIEKLLRHKFYFPDLLDSCPNITIIIGYVTAEGMAGAARSIHDDIFPNAHFVPILSYIPEELDKEPSEVQDLEYEIMEYVEKARFAISIGPKIHSHFTIKFNALENHKDNIEYIPAVDDQIQKKYIHNLNVIDQIHLLTFDFTSNTVEECTKRLDTIARASGKIANFFANRISTRLKIRGLSEDIGNQCKENLLNISNSLYLSIIHSSVAVSHVHAQNDALQDLSQCHLHLSIGKTKSFGMSSLLASAAGAPSLSTGLSGFAQLIKRDLTYYYDTVIIKDIGINQQNDVSAEIIKEKCIETLVEPRLYETFLKKTKDLQRDLKESMRNGSIAKLRTKLSSMFNKVNLERKQDSNNKQEMATNIGDTAYPAYEPRVFIQIDVRVTEPTDDDTLSKFESCDKLPELNDFLLQIGSRCEHVKRNSVLAIVVSCPTMQTLDNLWESYKSDYLVQKIRSDIVTKDILQAYGECEICLKVIIESWRHRQAKLELQDLIEGDHDNISDDSVTERTKAKPDTESTKVDNGGDQGNKSDASLMGGMKD